MPELPEVETIARGLRSQLVGHRCTDLNADWKKIFNPSFALIRRAVVGQILTEVSRQGKYLFLNFGKQEGSDDTILLMLHLRMTGQIFTASDYKPDKHVHAHFSFNDRDIWWRDIRKFGQITLLTDKNRKKALQTIGPDMLQISFKEWRERIAHRKAPLKNLLLNQQIASGIGNIYADEALFSAGLNPLCAPVALADAELKTLFKAIRSILRLAIRHNGTTFSDFVDFSGKPGNFKQRLQVYGRTGEKCNRCQTKITRLKLAGRSAHFCPHCQTEMK